VKTIARRIQTTLAVVTLVLSSGLAANSFAAEPEKMDIGTHRFLIEKLEAVLSATPKDDSTRVPALLRLADLYSEEARLLSMQEIERGCFQNPKAEGCGVSKKDRQLAIQAYEQALSESSGKSQSRILFQLAHLYEMDGENGKAAKLYRRILTLGPKQFSQIVLGQSQAGLGEIAFKEQRFSDAKRDFEKSLLNKSTPRRGWIQYRIAWSELNLGQPQKGKARLLSILQTPSLMVLDSTNSNKPDASFQEDIARDLTVFYAQTGFNQQDIEALWALSPEASRKSILMALAEEAERLGQKRAAITVWTMLAARPLEKDRLENRERIEALTRVATLRFGLGEKAKAVVDFRQALELWKKSSCSPEAECDLLQRRLRKLVVDWNKNEETKLSKELFEMYRLYAGKFSNDVEMIFWGANVGRELKLNREAVELYRQAAEVAAGQLSNGKPEIKTVFEGSLLSGIELAELTGDLKLRESAYLHYLKLNPNGAKALDVHYQLAQVEYARGDMNKASDRFYQIATRQEACRSNQKPALCGQAADLALDAIVILKNDERLEATALEFASMYPKTGKDYMAVARRARLNLAAKAANGTSTSQMTENLKKLSNLSLTSATREEVLLTHQNRFVLAEKTRDFAAANAAAVSIINFPGATASEREDAMAKRLWVAEMQLDFATAYVTARQMKFSNMKPADRELKLALLSDLAGKDSRPHLKTFISLTKNRQAELAARASLVKASNYSVAEFNRHFQRFQDDRGLFSSLALEVYSRNPSKTLQKKLLSVRSFKTSPEAGILVRAGELSKLNQWASRLAQSKLPSNASDKVLGRALQARVKQLADADRFANQQISTQDGWLQAVALQIVAKENRRLREEVLGLPVPKGLKDADANRYRALIARQVSPFEIKALKIDQRTKKFWNQNPADTVAKMLESSMGPKRQLIQKESEALVSVLRHISDETVAGSSVRRLETAIDSRPSEVRPSTLASARDDVRENPFDLDRLKRLRSLEIEAGRETMVTYLNSRMNQIGARQ